MSKVSTNCTGHMPSKSTMSSGTGVDLVPYVNTLHQANGVLSSNPVLAVITDSQSYLSKDNELLFCSRAMHKIFNIS